MLLDQNINGLTFGQWVKAARIAAGHDYFSYAVAYLDWKAGLDPAEYVSERTTEGK